jgi:hypothetical protein
VRFPPTFAGVVENAPFVGAQSNSFCVIPKLDHFCDERKQFDEWEMI